LSSFEVGNSDFVFLSALIELSTCIPDIVCITQTTLIVVNSALLDNDRQLFFSFDLVPLVKYSKTCITAPLFQSFIFYKYHPACLKNVCGPCLLHTCGDDIQFVKLIDSGISVFFTLQQPKYKLNYPFTFQYLKLNCPELVVVCFLLVLGTCYNNISRWYMYMFQC